MLKDITFGQYLPRNSLIHKIDPRFKIILLILNIVFIFLIKSYLSLITAMFFIAVILLLSKISISVYLKNIKAILPIIIFTAIINALYVRGGKILLSFWIITITSDGISKAIFMSLRVILFIIISAVLTYTTTPNDLTDALESLCTPLKKIGLSNAIHVLVMIMTIALRFIPTLIEETQKIINAQKARGADLENGSFTDKVKALIPILIPILIISIRRAYDLAEAMESRCYNGGVGKNRMKQFSVKSFDYFSLLFSFVYFVLIIVFNNFPW